MLKINPDSLNHYVIVYQFGKVGSTSLVNSMNKIEGINAVQCHFMGERILEEKIEVLVDSNTSEYFLKHEIGQFVRNVSITRELNAFRNGMKRDAKLVVISMTREPFDWFRSSFTQDIEGYIPLLQQFMQFKDLESTDDSDLISKAVPLILDHFADLLDSANGVEPLMRLSFDSLCKYPPIKSQISNEPIILIFKMMLRPFAWLEDNLYRGMRVHPSSFSQVEKGPMLADLKWAKVYIMRFESLAEHAHAVFNDLDIDGSFELSTDNTSREKPYASEIIRAFKCSASKRIKSHYSLTTYCKRFGYGYAMDK